MKTNKKSLIVKVAAISLGIVLSTTACVKGNSSDSENNEGSSVVSSVSTGESSFSNENSVASSNSSASSKNSNASSSKSSNSSASSSSASSSASSSSSSSSQLVPETGTLATLDLGTPHTFNGNTATEYAYGTKGSDFKLAFKLTKVSTKNDSFTVNNGKTKFRQGDIIENTEALAGVTSITVNGGNGFFKLYAGYSKENMYQFLEAESKGGSRVFENIPNMNYFKFVGTYDNYDCDISSIEFTYTRNAAKELVYGEETASYGDIVKDGTYTKGTSTLVVANNTLTLNDVSYSYAKVVYNGAALFTNNGNNLLAKNDGDNLVIVTDCQDRYSTKTGTYTKKVAATKIDMSVNGTVVAANTESSRYEIDVDETFTFAATSDAIPAETVDIALVDETYSGEVDPFVGTYTPRGTLTVRDFYDIIDTFELTMNPIVITKVGNGYKATYSDVAQGNYPGVSGTFDCTTTSDSISFMDEEQTFYVTLDKSNSKISFGYYGDSFESYCNGETYFNFASANKPTASFENGVVKGLNGGNCKLVCTTANNITATYYVKVADYVPATLTLNPTSGSVEKGQTLQINASVNNDATKKTISYTSNKTSIATVSETGLITGVAKGSTTITVKTADDTKTFTVTVTEPAAAAQEFLFADDNGDIHTLVVIPNVSATIDTTVATFTYTNGHYYLDEGMGCYIDIRHSGTNYIMDVEDPGAELYSTCGLYMFTPSYELA